VRNADWLSKLTFADVIRLCSHFTVAQFLERDNFEQRWLRHDAIHVSEFMYAIMQGYDAVALETDVQVGGTDQLFNLLAGRVLQREHGQPPQVAITTPLLVGTDGVQKMSKSAGNYIAVDDPPNEMYGKVMSLPDSAMELYFKLLTPLAAGEVTSILESVERGALPPMDAKKRLALEITAAMYPRAEAAAAQGYFESTIQRGETPQEMREYALPDGDGGERSRLDRVLVSSGLAASGGEVRRLVEQGAVSVNGERVTDFTVQLHPGDEVKVGSHRFVRLVQAGAQR
jgi:tyrosyl-tRNA synthetase